MMSVEGWEKSSLISLLKILKSGGTPNTSRSNFYGGEIPFVSIEDMSASRKYLWSTVKSLTKEGLSNSNTWLVPENSLLYSIYATLGLVRINKIPVTTNQAILAMIVDDEIVNQDYLYYWLEYIRNSVINLSSQTTQSNLSATIVKPFIVQHPKGKKEQTKIAAILSTIDRAIEQTESIIAKQQRIKTGLMQDLLTKGIDEDGNVRSEATHEFKDSPLGRIPVEWKLYELDKITAYITSGSRWWARFYSNEGAVFIRIGNLTREHINLKFDDIQYVQPLDSAERERTAVQEGDLLISVTADLGIIGVIPRGFTEAYMNQHIALVRLNQINAQPRFVGHYLASNNGRKQFDHFNESGAKSGLNLPTVGRICVALPNLTEQENISTFLDLEDQRISKIKSDLAKLKRMKTGLMQDLLTGNVRVMTLLKEGVGA